LENRDNKGLGGLKTVEKKDNEQVYEQTQVEQVTQENEELSKKETAEELEEILAEEETSEEKAEAEKETKPRRGKKKEAEEEFVEERIYTIPLGRAWVRPPKKRAPRAMQIIRAYVTKHMKIEMRVEAEEERGELPRLIISNDINEKVWGKGIEKPPRKIRVRAGKDKEGNVTVYLAEGE
jgi:large subunit ribosomal protein L31e